MADPAPSLGLDMSSLYGLQDGAVAAPAAPIAPAAAPVAPTAASGADSHAAAAPGAGMDVSGLYGPDEVAAATVSPSVAASAVPAETSRQADDRLIAQSNGDLGAFLDARSAQAQQQAAPVRTDRPAGLASMGVLHRIGHDLFHGAVAGADTSLSGEAVRQGAGLAGADTGRFSLSNATGDPNIGADPDANVLDKALQYGAMGVGNLVADIPAAAALPEAAVAEAGAAASPLVIRAARSVYNGLRGAPLSLVTGGAGGAAKAAAGAAVAANTGAAVAPYGQALGQIAGGAIGGQGSTAADIGGDVGGFVGGLVGGAAPGIGLGVAKLPFARPATETFTDPTTGQVYSAPAQSVGAARQSVLLAHKDADGVVPSSLPAPPAASYGDIASPNVAQAYGTPGASVFTRAIQNIEPGAINSQHGDNVSALAGAVGGMAPAGDPFDLAARLRAQSDADAAARQAPVTAAQQAVGAAQDSIVSTTPGALDASANGEAVRQAVADPYQAAKGTEGQLWDGLANATVHWPGVQRATADWLSSMPQATRATLTGDENGVLRAIGAVTAADNGLAPHAEMQAIRSTISDARNSLGNSGNRQAAMRLGNLQSALDAEMDDQASPGYLARAYPNQPVPGLGSAPTSPAPAAPAAPPVPPSMPAAAPVGRPAAPSASTLAPSIIRTPPGTPLPVDYRLAEASDLNASHDALGNVNPAFPAELQPRDRSLVGSVDQVQRAAANLQPDRLGVSPDTATGAPVVDQAGNTLSGNGRLAAIQAHYASGGTSYRDWLEAQGYPTDGMKQPVLVRQAGPLSSEEAQRIASESNDFGGLARSASEQAASDAGRITPDTATSFSDGDLGGNANGAAVGRTITDIGGNAGDWLDPDGRLSRGGETRLRAALTHYAYGDGSAPLMRNLLDSRDEDGIAFAKSLQAVAPQMARLRGLIQRGEVHPSTDISAPLSEAASIAMNARRSGTRLSDALAQPTMFGPQHSPMAVALLHAGFGPDLSSRFSRARMQATLAGYAARAENNRADMNDMFGSAPSPKDILHGVTSALPPVDIASQGNASHGGNAAGPGTAGSGSGGGGAAGARVPAPGAGGAPAPAPAVASGSAAGVATAAPVSGAGGAAGGAGGGGAAVLARKPYAAPGIANGDLNSYAQARAYTRQLHQTFDAPGVGPVLAKQNGAYKVLDSAVARQATSSPEAFRNYLATASSPDAVMDHVAGSFRAAAQKTDGTWSGAAAQKWVSDHRDLLREASRNPVAAPAAARFSDAAGALAETQKRLGDANATFAAAEKAAGDGIVAQVLKVDPERMGDRLMSLAASGTGPSLFADLAARSSDPATRSAVQSSLLGALSKNFLGLSPGADPVNAVTKTRELNNTWPLVRSSFAKILHPDQIAVVDKLADYVKDTVRWNTVGKGAAGPSTAADTMLAANLRKAFAGESPESAAGGQGQEGSIRSAAKMTAILYGTNALVTHISGIPGLGAAAGVVANLYRSTAQQVRTKAQEAGIRDTQALFVRMAQNPALFHAVVNYKPTAPSGHWLSQQLWRAAHVSAGVQPQQGQQPT